MLTLLIYLEIPELTRMFLIPNEVAKEYRGFLDEAHNHFINSGDDMNDGMRFLNNALSTALTVEEWDDGEFNAYRGILCQYEVKTGSPILDTHITAVYHSGFIM